MKPDMERPARNAARLALDQADTGSSSVVWFAADFIGGFPWLSEKAGNKDG